MSSNEAQPQPTKNDLPAVWDLVIKDMRERDQVGIRKYGTRLQPHNGRDVLKDAYQEALDLAVYLRQAIFERDGETAAPELSDVPDGPVFSTDMGQAWQALGENIRIIYPLSEDDEEELHLVATAEGIILDRVNFTDGTVTATTCLPVDGLNDLLVEEDEVC